MKNKFCATLDAQELVRANGIIVLRNIDEGLTQERVEHGIELLHAGYGSFIMMPYADNTYEEAVRVKQSLTRNVGSLILVTHRDHHYRAFLTFLKVMPAIRFASAPIEALPNDIEFQKILNYQKLKHVASYTDGLKRLQ